METSSEESTSFEETMREKVKSLKEQVRDALETAKRNQWKRPLGQPPHKGPPGTPKQRR